MHWVVSLYDQVLPKEEERGGEQRPGACFALETKREE